jgi:hypothetical protein
MAGNKWHMRFSQSSRFVAPKDIVRTPKTCKRRLKNAGYVALKQFRARQTVTEACIERAIQRARRETDVRRGPVGLKKLSRLRSMKSIVYKGKERTVLSVRECTTKRQTCAWVILAMPLEAVAMESFVLV